MKRNIAPPLLLVFFLLFSFSFLLDALFSFLYSNRSSVEVLMQREDIATTTSIASSSVQQVPYYEVLRVVDGDTIDIALHGKTRVRLIGINTPEIVDPRRPVQCFGKEASAKAKELLLGKSITLEFDPSQDKYDKYGRLLAYVHLQDGTFFNEQMIRDGYAYEYTYRLPYKYQEEFKRAEYEAKSAKMGLWADGVCVSVTPTGTSSR
ncbi:MAG: hypothetical protein A2494_00450 [Candidatus Lloydbacteria bacterium RIFOXYC12_FULL_46_25]|uniref:TNase-like domain-containing protein n=1 Tax=Candidatus Lloydbacteria bacterium RIFOXYC12_FULL_46_25 TaxID=1798670 RepID=A0A1G2DXK6_9BACT|nr:MAG: hypothetical protein A2494_00450 [Candidatus Lloydbacteria bacterium RIFOXYC12_FULL_46_25]